MKRRILILVLALVSLFSTNMLEAKEKKDTMKIKTAEISISGLRYNEELLELPMAISIIEEKDLNQTKGLGLDEALKSTPGVLAQSRYGIGDVRISVRGFGTRGAGDRSNAGTSRGIKVIIDGIPQTEPDGRTSFDNIDLSLVTRMEVLRSNASSIWGNGAGGVINLSTEPLYGTDFAELTYTGGSYGLQKEMFRAGTQLSANSKMWVSLINASSDGYRANSDLNKKQFNLGIKSLLGKSTNVGFYLSYVDNAYKIPGPLTQKEFDSLPTLANPRYLKNAERRMNKVANMGVTIDHNFDENNSVFASAYLNPKYLQRSERNSYRDFTRYHLGSTISFRNTMKFGDDIKNTALVGYDHAYQDGAILFYALDTITFQNRSNVVSQNKKEGANVFGLYFQDEIKYKEDLSILLGGRYDAVNYFNQNFLVQNLYQQKEFSHFTPKIAVSYKLAKTSSVYFNVGGGVEVPAGNETDPNESIYKNVLFNPLLEPIISNTIELGTKGFTDLGETFPSLSYDVAAYMINVKNDIVPYEGGKYYGTAGKTKRIGVELGANLKSNFGLEFGLTLTYCQAKYDEYFVDSSYIKSGATGKVDYSKNKQAGVPEMYYNFNLRYVYNEWEAKPYIDLNFNGMGEYFADDANKYAVKAYSIINAKIGFESAVLAFSGINLKPWLAINNLADTKYIGSAFINPDIDKTSKLPIYIEAGLPRNIVFGVNVLLK